MKNITLAILMALTTGVFAKNITKTIMVHGQCEMCKGNIEEALDLPGISFAEWNQETKTLTVRYNDSKISENDIHTAISNLGYATGKMTANKEGQKKLAHCCKPKEVKPCGVVEKGCCSK